MTTWEGEYVAPSILFYHLGGFCSALAPRSPRCLQTDLTAVYINSSSQSRHTFELQQRPELIFLLSESPAFLTNKNNLQHLCIYFHISMFNNWTYNFRCILTVVKPPTPQENNKMFQPIRGQESASTPVRIRGGEGGGRLKSQIFIFCFPEYKKKKKN